MGCHAVDRLKEQRGKTEIYVVRCAMARVFLQLVAKFSNGFGDGTRVGLSPSACPLVLFNDISNQEFSSLGLIVLGSVLLNVYKYW